MSLIGESAAGPGPGPADLIKDGTDASFMADVVEASKAGPVIIDFWAPWCGPCKTLGPMLERAVVEARGAVTLVKINMDENPVYARQLQVQSIPAVFAIHNGKVVDNFLGALPESQVKAFVAKVASAGGASEIETVLKEAKAMLDAGDVSVAAQAFSAVLQHEPQNVAAIGGLARAYLSMGDLEKARGVAEMAPAGAKNADLESVRAALALAENADSETGELEARLAKDASDHEARFELAKALAGQGNLEAAADHLLTIIEADREWNEDAARKQLLTVFEAAGFASEVARQGRRRLSAILFS